MTKARRRRLDPEERKQELIEAAERELRLRGSDCRVEDVVRAAGAAKGTFYVYFETWDDLLLVLRERIYADFNERFPIPAPDADIDWWQRLDEVLDGAVDTVLELGGVHQAIFHGPFAERFALPAEQGSAGWLARFIEVGAEARAFAKLDAGPSAQLLFPMIHAAADAIEAGGDRDAYLAALRALVRRCLAK